MLGFVESPNRRKPTPPEANFNPRKLFFIGLSLILGFTILLLPFGAYFPVTISIWALLVFFLPLLFIGISLISKYGYVILIAVFLSLLDGGISVLYFGDFLGFLTETTAVANMDPREVVLSSRYKYVYLKDFLIKSESGGSFQAPITIRARGKSKLYGPVLHFKYAPIVWIHEPNIELALYALCYANSNETCSFSSSIKGGSVIRDVIWDTEKSMVQGIQPKEGAVFLVWRENGEQEFHKKGLWSLAGILISILLWAVACFRKRMGL